MTGRTLLVSIGRYGGFYVHRGYTWRLCIGWVALTAIPRDDEWVLKAILRGAREEGGSTGAWR